MMHHPNMHHQPMSGHPPPPQHLSGHQGLPTHHQMPPHQMHRENRHVTLTRVQMGPTQSTGIGGHGQMGGMGSMSVAQHHTTTQRPPHPIRPMHHPSTQHHSVPPVTGTGGHRQMGGMGSMPIPQHHASVAPYPAHAPSVVTTPLFAAGRWPSKVIGMGGHRQMGGMGSMPVQQHQAPTPCTPHSCRRMQHPSTQHHPVSPVTGKGGHRQMGGMGSLSDPLHHASSQRASCLTRHVHHPPNQYHTVLPQQNRLRRPYSVGGGYGPSSVPGVLPPPFTQPPPLKQSTTQQSHNGPIKPPSPKVSVPSKLKPDFVTPPVPLKATNSAPKNAIDVKEESGIVIPSGSGMGTGAATDAEDKKEKHAATGEGEARAAAPANSKEKTPMCLVNELARYNKIKHQYRLTSETGPAHKKVFTVTLRLGDTEEYTAEGSSIKRAQHAAASAALSGTCFPPPPPRALPSHAHHASHHRHAGAVMPTVELNALAMKLCQPAVYTSVPAVPRPRPRLPYRLPTPFVPPYPHATHGHTPRILESSSLLYRVRLSVGGRSWVGEGATPQGARHDAAARALLDMRPSSSNESDNESGSDLLNSEVKSPVSLVHELALKRNLSVQFTVKSERGPPHMRVFITACTVGDMETEGEGNGKKVSKRRAAERMLEEMRRRWPPALLRARPPADRRRHAPTKKKPRNLIKEGGAGTGSGSEGGNGSCTGAVTSTAAVASGGADNPISRLAVARHAARARSPQYRVLEERGAARRREFLVQCDAPPHCATGLGPNKKAAKRRAAHNVLLAMELGNNASDQTTSNGDAINGSGDANKTNNVDAKRKENESNSGGANSDVRQPVPGVLMMDYHQRTGQPSQPNGVSETSATGGVAPTVGAVGVGSSGATGPGSLTPGAKDQLMYLSQLLGFTVQFSDFPKRNHGEYLSLVSLSTEPPVMCHGGGASTAHSHEQSARAALRALALMGLDAPTTGSKQSPAGKPGVISTGNGD